MLLHYFQKPKRTSQFQFYVVTLLHAFVVILNVFEELVFTNLKFVDQSWVDRLRSIGRRLEQMRSQLIEQGAGVPDGSPQTENTEEE
jgi:hypothetical protein